MTLTVHGHHIDGTNYDGEIPIPKARCGGPGLCSECSKEAAQARKQESSNLFSSLRTRPDHIIEIRTKALEAAVRSNAKNELLGVHGKMVTEAIVERAHAFEKYIKEGKFDNAE